MLKFSVDLDVPKGAVTTRRSVKKGDTFQIALTVEDDGKDPTPAEFDTLIMEVLFNDEGQVLRVDPDERPVAGDLGVEHPSAADAFTLAPIRGGRHSDPQIPFSKGSELTLLLPNTNGVSLRGARFGPYRNSTGQAGIIDRENPIKLTPGKPLVFAMGKVDTGVHALATGKSRMVAIGHAFRNNEPVPARSTVSTVSIS